MKTIVTFYVDDNGRRKILDELSGKTDVIFLKDINREDRADMLREADILLSWNISKEVEQAQFNKLKFVQLISAGYDHLKFDIFPGNCVIAANQGAYSGPMAEHVVALILAFSKRLIINHKLMKQGVFDQATVNKSLREMSAGIIGFGGIGKATADLLKAFGVKILAVNTSGRTDTEVEFIGTLDDLEFVISHSDIIILSIPLSEATRGLISEHELKLMKTDAILINVARGDIIVEKDLYEHLKANPDFSAGIEAWWNEPFKKGEFKSNYPFLDLPNVIGSPHNSALTTGSLEKGQIKAVKNIVRFLLNEQVRGIVKRN